MRHIFYIVLLLGALYGCTPPHSTPSGSPCGFKPQESLLAQIPPLPRSKAGYVYIIENTRTMGRGIYKIGMTQREDPNVRIKEIGDASVPFPFTIVYLLKSGDCRALEKHLHHCFKAQRLNDNREFFKLTRRGLSSALKTA